jgi:hypothetical protein
MSGRSCFIDVWAKPYLPVDPAGSPTGSRVPARVSSRFLWCKVYPGRDKRSNTSAMLSSPGTLVSSTMNSFGGKASNCRPSLAGRQPPSSCRAPAKNRASGGLVTQRARCRSGPCRLGKKLAAILRKLSRDYPEICGPETDEYHQFHRPGAVAIRAKHDIIATG